MATQADVRRIALALPSTTESAGKFGFEVAHPKGKSKGLTWLWRERVDPKKPKVPNPGVIVIPVANLDEKAMLLAADPDVFFTEPHYDGYAAVLVRLTAVRVPALRTILTNAWGCVAPKPLLEALPKAKSNAKTKSKSNAKAKSKKRTS